MKPSWYVRAIFGSTMTWYIFALFFLVDANASWKWWVSFAVFALYEKENEIRDKLAALEREKK